MDTQVEKVTPRRRMLVSLNEFLRWLLFVAVTTAGIAAFVAYFIHARLDEEIRCFLETKFQTHYTDLHVSLQSARRIAGVGIEIRGLSIRDPKQQGDRNELIQVDEILVRCQTELRDLVAGRIDLKELVLRRMRLCLGRREDGTWNVDSLLPLPQFSERSYPVVVEQATVAVLSQSGDGGRTVVLPEVNLMVRPEMDGTSAGSSAGPSRRCVSGEFRGGFFDSAAILEGHYDPSSGDLTIHGTIEGLEVSPEVLAAVPGPMRARLVYAEALRGKLHVEFRAEGAIADLMNCRFAISGSYQGRIEDPRLPRPLTDVRAIFDYDNKVFRITQASARSGETTFRGSGTFAEPGRPGPLRIQADIERLALDEELAALLPEDWLCLWHKLSPRGLVNADLDLAYDGRRWTPDVSVECLDVSLAYDRFPYRLESAHGQVGFKDGLLRLDNLRALASGREIRIEGQFLHPGPDCTGWIEFAVEQPIPLDEKLLTSLRGKGQEIVRSLHAQGMVTVWGRLERQSGNPPVEHKRLEIGLIDCSIQYDAFRYPLYRIRGTLSMTDDHWRLRELEGYNDSGWVVCNGSWAPQPQGGTQLILDFNAMDVPLEDELRDALKPEMQRVWNNLCPRGTVDHLGIAVRYDSATRDLSLDVTALKRPPTQNVEGRSVSVKPAWLPYSWDNVVGQVRFRDGLVELQRMRATHGATRVELSGEVRMAPSGDWHIRLSPLNVDCLDSSRELAAALPPRLGAALARLKATGLASVRGWLEMAGGKEANSPSQAAWKLDFDLENGGLDCGVQLEHLHGGLSLQGSFDGNVVVGDGELAVDSLMYKGIQWSRVTGPLHFDDSGIWFGRWIPQAYAHEPTRPLTASVWGGTLEANARVLLEEATPFELEALLLEGDLAAISREATAQKHNVTGRTFARIHLSGCTEGAHTLRGQGRMQLREADIYQLPVMVRLLKLLSVKPPDRTAFTSADVDFRMEGDRIYFDRIDFEGDAISLDGRGEMNLQREIELTFGTTVGRDDYYASLLRPVLKEAGRRLMVIHVSGTVEDPQVKSELVPQLNQTFQQIFPGMPRSGMLDTSRVPDPRRALQRTWPR